MVTEVNEKILNKAKSSILKKLICCISNENLLDKNLVKDKINENVEKLYDLDNNLFDDRGVCKLDSRLRLDYQDNQPLKIQLENKIFKE